MTGTLKEQMKNWAEESLDVDTIQLSLEQIAQRALGFENSSRTQGLIEEFAKNPTRENALRYYVEWQTELWEGKLAKLAPGLELTESNVLGVLRQQALQIVQTADSRCIESAACFVEVGWMLRRHWGEVWGGMSGYDRLKDWVSNYSNAASGDFIWSSVEEQRSYLLKCSQEIKNSAAEFLAKSPV